MREEGAHEPPPQAEKLLTVDGFSGREFLFKGVTSGRSTILRWVASPPEADKTAERRDLDCFLKRTRCLGGGACGRSVGKRNGSGYDQNTWREKC